MIPKLTATHPFGQAFATITHFAGGNPPGPERRGNGKSIRPSGVGFHRIKPGGKMIGESTIVEKDRAVGVGAIAGPRIF